MSEVAELKIQCAAKLARIMDSWCESHVSDYSGGKMRDARGADIETFVRETITDVGKIMGRNLVAIKGDNDKKELKVVVDGEEIKKDHRVDVHIYLDGRFIAVIECKAYLDSCYYVRACDDFKLFKKFGYNIKQYVFTLENSLAENTKKFHDHVTDHVCDDVFYILDGKRSSTKPVYDAQYKKPINEKNMSNFVDHVCGLCDL